MDTAAEMAKGSMDDETVWMVFDVLKNRCVQRGVCVCGGVWLRQQGAAVGLHGLCAADAPVARWSSTTRPLVQVLLDSRAAAASARVPRRHHQRVLPTLLLRPPPPPSTAHQCLAHIHSVTTRHVTSLSRHCRRNEWWVPGKILDIRRRLDGTWRSPGVSRDVLLLDIALDNYFR